MYNDMAPGTILPITLIGSVSAADAALAAAIKTVANATDFKNIEFMKILHWATNRDIVISKQTILKNSLEAYFHRVA